MQGPARGVPFVELFLAVFETDFKKEHSCFEVCKVFEFVKVCFVYAFEKHSITIKNHSTTIKNRTQEKHIQVRQKGCFLLKMLIPIYNCKCKGLQGVYPLWSCFWQFWKRI